MLRSLSFIQFKGNVNEDDARDCFLEVQDWQGVNSNLFFIWNFKLHCLLSFFSFAVFCFVYLNVFGTLIYGFGVWMSLILCFVYLNVFGTLNSLIYGFGVWISLILDPSDSLLKHNILALCCFSFFFFPGYRQVEIANFLELWLGFALFSIWISMNSNPKF